MSRGDQTGPEVLLGWPLAQPQRGVWSFDGGTWVAVGVAATLEGGLGLYFCCLGFREREGEGMKNVGSKKKGKRRIRCGRGRFCSYPFIIIFFLF